MRSGDMVREVQRKRVLSEIVSIGIRDFNDPVPNAVEPKFVVESAIQCLGRMGYLEEVNGEQALTTEGIENVIMMVPFTGVLMWTFEEKTGNSWRKILWDSGKTALIFSVSIETLQLLLRLGTFQLSDIFYNTVGGVIGGLMYYGIRKARKRL